MAQADRIFRKSFRRHFTNHEANFPPTRTIALGDFGVLENGYFTRLGNITQNFNIPFETVNDENPTHEEFKSEGDVSITFWAKGDVKPGGVPVAKAQIDFGFSSKQAFYFSAAEVCYLQIRNLLQVGERIVELYNQGVWKKSYVLISTLLEGTNAIVIISGSSNASITVEAQSEEVAQIDLGNAGVKFGFKSSSSVAYQVISPNTCQIGFALSRIYDLLFHQPSFKMAEPTASVYTRLDNEESRMSPVVFGNIPTEIYDDEEV